MKGKKHHLYYPVVAIFLIAITAAMSLGYYTLNNLHSEEKLMFLHLTGVGATIMKAVESSTTVGMMGMPWQKRQLQALFEKIEQQANVEYLYLVDRNGKIVVSSASGLRGHRPAASFDFAALDVDSVVAELVTREGGVQVLETRKRFQAPDMHTHMMMPHMRQQMGMSSDPNGLAIVVGLSTDDFFAARKEDTRRALGSGLILLILAFASTFFALVIRKYYAANQSLEMAESFIRNVIESMGHGLVALDAAGKIVTINKKACRLLQVDENSAIGHDFTGIMQHVHCSIDKEQILQENWTEKKVRCSVDGKTTVPISLTIRRMSDARNNASGTVILMRDLQEIEALEDRVKRSERLASLGQMAAGIAHEVRNPLGSIKGLAQYFARKFEQVPDEKKYAEAIISETDRLDRVIGDLLDFARPQEPAYRQCDLARIIDHALALVRADLEIKRLRVERSGEKEIPLFEADPDLLSQAFMNLFLNAVEATNSGGTLSIRCEYLAEQEKIRVQIEDTGAGIRPADIGKVFDPFFTLKKGGTGLGLALVHRIVDNHGGSIEVASLPEKGTTFTINLPLKP